MTHLLRVPFPPPPLRCDPPLVRAAATSALRLRHPSPTPSPAPGLSAPPGKPAARKPRPTRLPALRAPYSHSVTVSNVQSPSLRNPPPLTQKALFSRLVPHHSSFLRRLAPYHFCTFRRLAHHPSIRCLIPITLSHSSILRLLVPYHSSIFRITSTKYRLKSGGNRRTNSSLVWLQLALTEETSPLPSTHA